MEMVFCCIPRVKIYDRKCTNKYLFSYKSVHGMKDVDSILSTIVQG